ncbi:hypothetical protein [Paraburkholderia nemoris]|uniref:hypothetical protein n=1 Tax=Paraburkholderia nemoris TaxID=2793076 RepID=UPI001B0DB1D5|nr:hypothetical protein [Paraburkholderia nemoris]CAE6837990.1 hypothetical protein R75777_06926 [Paraburkholderia nemoris]
MESFLKRFESLGDNCEFGFVLQHHGIHDGGMLRWTMIRDFRDLQSAIDRKFEGIYDIDDLSPCSPDMVRDERFGIEFHTKMPIVRTADGFDFATPKSERLSVHYFEREKYFYLTEKFFNAAKRGSKIYVLKSINPIAQSVVEGVLRSLRRHGDVSILWVCEQDAANQTGTLEKLNNNLYRGFITRFSPSLDMNDIDMPVWAAVCEAAWNLHTSIHGSVEDDPNENPRPKQQPVALPSWFDPKLYLIANPDVAESGMDAGEHYLKFGWHEGRATRH